MYTLHCRDKCIRYTTGTNVYTTLQGQMYMLHYRDKCIRYITEKNVYATLHGQIPFTTWTLQHRNNLVHSNSTRDQTRRCLPLVSLNLQNSHLSSPPIHGHQNSMSITIIFKDPSRWRRMRSKLCSCHCSAHTLAPCDIISIL